MAKKTKSSLVGTRYKPEDIIGTKTADFHTVYSNNVAFAMSAFDVSLIFGEIASTEGGKVQVDQKLRVTMSPQHAKVLALVMIENIKAYESNVGPIAIPMALAEAKQVSENGKD